MRDTGRIEVWGGAEITCNRVGDSYLDQLTCSGHHSRSGDLEEFAALGLRTLRYGLIWERHEQDPSWKWSDARLSQIRELGIRPIAGLVHHGSGPSHTGLLDPQFPEKLAAYAEAVARRYPWIDAYTPVNEPNTTARFSGLYGLWYPHHLSRRSYLQALLHQVKGSVLSMAAIRRIQPKAQFIQTEDAGQVWTTDELRGTGELLNHRRWLPFDLLCGMVERHHPLYCYMRAEGIPEEQILWFRDHPCPPDVVGLNYYVTSDRFLDHRVERYPRSSRSAEGRFVDVEAVRVRPEGIAGFESILMEAWNRYRLPVAITELHLGDDPEEQIRWVAEAWDGAQRARRAGAQCVALTIWALLGSYHWNVLVTNQNGDYEPGVFDVSGGTPVRTALAEVVGQIARNEAPNHPALARRGWWQRADRIAYTLPEVLPLDALAVSA